MYLSSGHIIFLNKYLKKKAKLIDCVTFCINVEQRKR